MRRAIVILFLILMVFVLNAEKMVVRIPNPAPATFEQFQSAEADIALYHPGKVLDLVVTDTEFAQLILQYPELVISQSEAQLKRNLGSKERDIPGYRSYDDLMLELGQLLAFYPNLVEIHTIGAGWGQEYAALGWPAYQDYDHEIHAIKLSDNVSQTEDEAQFYFVGTHHAREPISLEVTMEILYHLIDSYGTDPQITQIVDSSEIWFIPLLNPDGHKLVIDQSDVWWRKNIRDNNDNHSIDTASYGNGYDGVDLNRNYSYMWGNISASDDPYSVTYHGSEPFSEPETQALRDFLAAGHFLAGISYHTYGEYVLYPYGFAHNLSGPDHQEQALLAEQMAASIPKVGYGTYDPMPSYSLYPVSGSSEDWIYGSLGAFSYTIEMATEFIPPASQVPEILQNHLQAAMILLQRKDHKTLTGHVTDATTGAALKARIRVEGIDEHIPGRADTWSREDFGTYYRFLPEGTFTVHYSCEGYLNQTHSVQISSSEQTIQDIALQPAALVNQQILITDLDDNPIPDASFRLEQMPQVYSDAQGLVHIMGIYSGAHQIEISHPDFATMQFQAEFSGNPAHYRLSADAIFHEAFEGTLADWTVSGSWGIVQDSAANGTMVLTDSPSGNYASNTSSILQTSLPVDLSAAEMVNISFQARCEISPDSDYAAFGYRYAGDSDFHIIDIFTGTREWSTYSYQLDFLAGESVHFGFAMISNSSANADGVYIDDIKIFTATRAVENQDLVSPVARLNCFPNPFKDQLQIELGNLPKGASEVAIYNLKGQKIRSLDTKSLTPEAFTVKWDGKDENHRSVASGIYFLRLSSEQKTLATRKILKPE